MSRPSARTFSRCVTDGEFLLRQIQWQRTDSYGEICDKYVLYLFHKYKSPKTIVFDGYGPPTKDAEHDRRFSFRQLTGIKERCLWNQVPSFHATENVTGVSLHDLEGGVCVCGYGIVLIRFWLICVY